jgi:molybdopterin-containing oxidoreductase family membrane subunit
MVEHANTHNPVDGRAPLVLGDPSFSSVTEDVARPIEGRTPSWWFILFGFAFSLLLVLLGSTGYLFIEGTGVWGLNNPTFWGWAIVNFVFWVGIGHAGTLISAVLFLFRQKWRTSINRFAEAMTIFAVMCALIFPTIHVGRVWVIWWVFPIPNQMEMWPQFRSPLLWDVFAVSIYGTVSLLFWYVGLIPDLATMRDRATTRIRQVVYGLLSLGWRGSTRHWHHYEVAYLILAGLATPLVLSVHSIVSFDFAVSQLPGWHTAIFPPYFVTGAIFSGFAMVLTLMIIARQVFGLQRIMTMRHLENMAKIILLTGSLVGYAYGVEMFMAWYSGNKTEWFTFVNRALGDYAWAYWIMIGCNVIVPQLFWFKKARTTIWMLFVLSIFVNIGMWFERFVIVVTLTKDFLPSSWDYYAPTLWDVAAFVGSVGLFFTMFLLFLRFIPMIAIAEVKTAMPASDPHAAHPEEGDRARAEGRSEDSDADPGTPGDDKAGKADTDDDGKADTDDDGKANTNDDGKANTDDDGKANTDDDGKANTDDGGKANTDDDGKANTDDGGRADTDDDGKANTDDEPGEDPDAPREDK